MNMNIFRDSFINDESSPKKNPMTTILVIRLGTTAIDISDTLPLNLVTLNLLT